MTRADLYVRLSIDVAAATSIERQEADCRRWCAARGITVRRVHVDRGVSGFSERAHRDGFDAALAAVTDGEVDVLVVWKLDRLSRRGIGQVGQLLDRFEKAGARLIAVQDQLDTAQPQARMILALLSEFARAESETIGVRIRSAKEAQRSAGLWLSGKPPFGYAVAADHRLTTVEPAATVMRDVFKQILTGHTLTSICRHLNERGLRNSRGNPWKVSALSEALRSPAYAGLQPARHVTADGRHAAGYPEVYRDRDSGMEVSCLTPGTKPITARAQQLAALAVLQTRLQRYGRGSVPHRPAYALLLRGLGRCAGCDRPLVTYGSSYRCRRVDAAGNLVCTQPANAGITTVDRRVEQTWHHLITTGGPDLTPLRRQVMLRWSPAPTRPTGWRRLQTQLDDLHARLADADDARYVRGDLDEHRHANVTHKLTHRIAGLEAELADTEITVDTAPLNDPDYVSTHWQAEAPDGRRELLRLTWTRIVIAKASIRGGHFDPRRLTYVPR